MNFVGFIRYESRLNISDEKLYEIATFSILTRNYQKLIFFFKVIALAEQSKHTNARARE